MAGALTIVSGGQTGVDQGALDAALDTGAPCGGWCPEGRMSEDGVIPERYPVEELAGAGYRQRTRQNVIDSDATVIVYFGEVPSGGTALTVDEAVKHGKPHLLIDGDAVPAEEAAATLAAFCAEHGVERLNVAGPRASGAAQGHDYARRMIGALLERLA